MAYSDHRLHLYDTTIGLVVTEDGIYLDNRPMDQKRLQAHKGINNTLLFTVTNRDRRVANLTGKTLAATLVDPTNRRVVITKLLEVTEGVSIKLMFMISDLAGITPGLYTMFITASSVADSAQPLYADLNNNIKFDIQITDQAASTVVPTQEETILLQVANVNTGAAADVYATSAMRGNHDANSPNPMHCIAVYVQNYTGLLTFQASCLALIPSTSLDSLDWFTADTRALTGYTGIVYVSFTVNANWVRVLSTPTSGTLERILLRN